MKYGRIKKIWLLNTGDCLIEVVIWVWFDCTCYR